MNFQQISTLNTICFYFYTYLPVFRHQLSTVDCIRIDIGRQSSVFTNILYKNVKI